MGRADERPAAARLLCERAARCDDGGFARLVRGLLRDNRWPGLWIERWRRHVECDRARSAGSALSRSADASLRNPKLAGGEKSQIPMPKSQVNSKTQDSSDRLTRESLL